MRGPERAACWCDNDGAAIRMTTAERTNIAASFTTFAAAPKRLKQAAPRANDDVVARPRIAYLTNLYPAISHSFIRTEIEALERLGFTVERFTIRRGETSGHDRDIDEIARTRSLLDGNRGVLATAVCKCLLRHPRRTIGALYSALREACRGGVDARRMLRGVAYFAEAASLADALRRSGVRHIHVHFGTNPATVARLACKLAPLSFSFTAHGPDEFDSPQTLDLHGKIADAAFAVAVSDFGRSQLLRWSEPADWPRVRVVRCAVASHFLTSRTSAASASRRFVAVARLSAQKGLPLLVEAAALVAQDRDFTLDLIGDGDQRGAIESRIAAAGLDGHIRLLGWRSPEQVLHEIASARALVLPSFAEGLPVVLMEALVLRRAVIATAVAGIPELVDAETGWLVPAGSVEALAAAMRAALDAPPARLRAMGEAGRKRVLAMHDPDINARHLAELFMPLV